MLNNMENFLQYNKTVSVILHLQLKGSELVKYSNF